MIFNITLYFCNAIPIEVWGHLLEKNLGNLNHCPEGILILTFNAQYQLQGISTASSHIVEHVLGYEYNSKLHTTLHHKRPCKATDDTSVLFFNFLMMDIREL